MSLTSPATEARPFAYIWFLNSNGRRCICTHILILVLPKSYPTIPGSHTCINSAQFTSVQGPPSITLCWSFCDLKTNKTAWASSLGSEKLPQVFNHPLQLQFPTSDPDHCIFAHAKVYVYVHLFDKNYMEYYFWIWIYCVCISELLRENKRMLDKSIREIERERQSLQTQERKNSFLRLRKVPSRARWLAVFHFIASWTLGLIPPIKLLVNLCCWYTDFYLNMFCICSMHLLICHYDILVV